MARRPRPGEDGGDWRRALDRRRRRHSAGQGRKRWWPRPAGTINLPGVTERPALRSASAQGHQAQSPPARPPRTARSRSGRWHGFPRPCGDRRAGGKSASALLGISTATPYHKVAAASAVAAIPNIAPLACFRTKLAASESRMSKAGAHHRGIGLLEQARNLVHRRRQRRRIGIGNRAGTRAAGRSPVRSEPPPLETGLGPRSANWSSPWVEQDTLIHGVRKSSSATTRAIPGEIRDLIRGRP